MLSETFRGLIERADYYATREKFRWLENRTRPDLIEHGGLAPS